MNLESLPSELASLYLGIGSFDIRSLIPAQYQGYIEYLDPRNHEFSLDRGKIDVAYSDTSLALAVRGLNIYYGIPSFGAISASSVNLDVDGRLELKGNYNSVTKKGLYSKASLEGVVSGVASILGGSVVLQDAFSSESIGLDLDAGGDIKVGKKGGLSLDLREISARYSGDSAAIDVTTKGRFRFGRRGVAINVESLNVAYRDSLGSWSARFDIAGNGSYAGSFFRGAIEVARLSGDSRSTLSLELSTDLLSEFQFDDSRFNALLNGQELTFSGTKLTDVTASLGRSGSDLAPAIALRINGERRSFALETVLQRLLGFGAVDVRLMSTAAPNDGLAPAISESPAPSEPPTPQSSVGARPSLLGVAPGEAVRTITLSPPLLFGGRRFAQAVVGTERPDRIIGSSLGEILAGGRGKDRLRGGKGADGFLFEIPEFGADKADIIIDYNRRQGDLILVSREGFAGVSRVRLATVSGKSELNRAASRSNGFIYDERNGGLYVNADGSKSGFGEGGLITTLLGAPSLRPSDLQLV